MTARNEPQASEPLGKVPDWAWKRVNELCGVDMDKAFISVKAFARYIAAHEQPPVDPLEQAVDDAFCLLPLEWTRETFVRCVTDTLRARNVARLPAAAVAAIKGEKA